MAKYGKPESAFTGKGPGEMSREGAGPKKPKFGRRVPVDLASGKPTQPVSTWQKVKRFATRNERREIPADTQEKRLASIGATATKAIGGRGGGTRPEGQIDIETTRRKTVGPSAFSQQTKTQRAVSLLKEQRTGGRPRTAADIKSARPAVDPGKEIRDPRAAGAAKVTTHRGVTEGGDLGSYTVKGYKPPPVKRTFVKKEKGYVPPKRAETFGEIWGGLWGKKKK